MKLTASPAFALQPPATPSAACAPLPATAPELSPRPIALAQAPAAPRGVERLDRQALAHGFEIGRALTRGRIEGLQTALRILSRPAGQSAATEDAPQPHELFELQQARLRLCARLQSHYVQFLGNTQAAPPWLPRTARGPWRRQEIGRLLEEDLGWARGLQGDTRDLVQAIERLLRAQ